MSHLVLFCLVNLDEIFAPERANRTEKPKYILNEEMDRQIEREKKETKHHSLNMKQIHEEFRAKLSASEKRGKEKSEQRKERFKLRMNETNQFTDGLYKSSAYNVSNEPSEKEKMEEKNRVQKAKNDYKKSPIGKMPKKTPEKKYYE